MLYYWQHREKLNCSLNRFYHAIGLSKQGFHQRLERSMKQEEAIAYLENIICQIRADHPTMSCRAMYYKIQPEEIGRDKFEALCHRLGYTVTRQVNYARTTDSSGVIRFDNLLSDAIITSINQAFVSDITYYQISNRFYYITFIIDAYSRYILGYSVSHSLVTENTTLAALKMAIRHRKSNLPDGIIFHSDGGGQYYDKAFLKLTTHHRFRNSMCEYAYENGKAERINGIIKNNYLRHWAINSLEELVKAVDRSVSLYNCEKPHKALKYKTPLEVEKEHLSLLQPTCPMAIKSLDANHLISRGIEPLKIRANLSSGAKCIVCNTEERED